MQKHVNLVDLVKSFPTNIFSQNLASIQRRTSPMKFDHLAEKSEKSSISNLSTKVAGGSVGEIPSSLRAERGARRRARNRSQRTGTARHRSEPTVPERHPRARANRRGACPRRGARRAADRDHARRARGLRARALARKDPRRARRGGARSLVERFDIESYSDFSAQ